MKSESWAANSRHNYSLLEKKCLWNYFECYFDLKEFSSRQFDFVENYYSKDDRFAFFTNSYLLLCPC